MKKVLVFTLTVLFLIGLAANSDAMMAGKGMGMCKMGMSDKCPMSEKIRLLGLDKKQTEAVKTIHFRLKKEVIRKKADLEVAEIELKEILSKDPVDIEAAETKIRQIEALKSEIRIMHLKAQEGIKSKLTQEQRKKFGSMIEMHQMCDSKGMMRKCGMMQGMGHMCEEGSTPPATKHKFDEGS